MKRECLYLFDPLAGALELDSLTAALIAVAGMTQQLTAVPASQLHAHTHTHTHNNQSAQSSHILACNTLRFSQHLFGTLILTGAQQLFVLLIRKCELPTKHTHTHTLVTERLRHGRRAAGGSLTHTRCRGWRSCSGSADGPSGHREDRDRGDRPEHTGESSPRDAASDSPAHTAHTPHPPARAHTHTHTENKQKASHCEDRARGNRIMRPTLVLSEFGTAVTRWHSKLQL